MKAKFMKKIMVGLTALTVLAGTMFGSMESRASVIGPDPTVGSIEIFKTDSELNGLKNVGFTVVRVMELVPGTEAGKFASYKVAKGFESTFKDVDPDELGEYNTRELEALIDTLMQDYAHLNTGTSADSFTITTDDNGIAKRENVPLGLYLVFESDVPVGFTQLRPFILSVPMSTNTGWEYDVRVEAKNSATSVTKEMVLENGETATAGTATVGDQIDFRVTVQTPYWDTSSGSGKAIFKIADSMTQGLEFDQKSLKIEIAKIGNYDPSAYVDGDTVVGGSMGKEVLGSGTGAAQVAWDFVKSSNVGGEITWGINTHGFQIEFDSDWLLANRSSTLVLTYSAKLTDKAVIGPGDEVKDMNINSAKVVYNPNLNDEDDYDEVEGSAQVYTFAVQIDKWAVGTASQGGKTTLAGAEFGIYKDAACTQAVLTTGTVTTGKDGVALFARLGEGVYYIKEHAAPEGYKLLTNPIKIEIIADVDENKGEMTGGFTILVNDKKVETITDEKLVTKFDPTTGYANIAVENKKGFTLPETGGMGIAIFLIIGLLGMVVLSAAMMKKKRA
ncbi:MAG: SpaH/EbpB family LPXTG-anchored major pilin [Suipraeoptans sp.]